MAWRWGVHQDWEVELQARYKTYGQRFEKEVRRWLERLAKAAAANQELDGVTHRLDSDLDDVQAGRTSGWRYAWRQWIKEPWLSKIQGVLYVLQKHEPPWELWEGEGQFPEVASSFSCRIGTAFKVDRAGQKITFVWFSDLPGPGVKDG